MTWADVLPPSSLGVLPGAPLWVPGGPRGLPGGALGCQRGALRWSEAGLGGSQASHWGCLGAPDGLLWSTMGPHDAFLTHMMHLSRADSLSKCVVADKLVIDICGWLQPFRPMYELMLF